MASVPAAPAAPAAPVAPVAPVAAARRPLIYYGYWIVGAALVAQFVMAGSQSYVSGVFLKPMTDDLGWSRGEFAYAQTIGRVVMAFVGFFIGTYIDRFGGRAMMVIGATILGASLFLTGTVTELWQWMLLRGVMFTVGAAMIGILVVNVTLAKWFVTKRGRVVGVAAMGISLAGVVAPPLMTAFVDEFGWRAGWRALAVVAWLLIYPAALLMRRQPEDHGWHPDGMSDEEARSGGGAAAAADFANSFTRREALRTSTLYVIVIAFGMAGLGVGVMLMGTIPFLTDAGFSRSTAALMMTIMSLPAVISKPAWGWLIDFVSPKLLAAAGFMMSAIAIIVILVSAKAGATGVMTAGFLLMGLGYGGLAPLQEVVWASYFGRRYLGAVRGVALPFALFLGAGGPLAVQIYFDRVGNYDGAFVALGVAWALAAVLVMMVRRPVKPGGTAPPPPPAPPPEPPLDVRPQPNGGAPAAAARALDGNGSGNGASIPTTTARPRTATAPPARPRAPSRDYMRGR